MASQMIYNSWRNSRLKLAKCYGNWEHISKKNGHSSNFLCFLLMNYQLSMSNILSLVNNGCLCHEASLMALAPAGLL